MCNILKDGGMLISSEPTLEGIGLRSLIFNDIYDMVDNFNSNTFKEEQGSSEYRFPLHDKNKILSLYSDSVLSWNLKRDYQYSISLLG